MYNPSHNNFWNACWLLAFFLFNVGVQWQIQGRTLPLFLDQTEACFSFVSNSLAYIIFHTQKQIWKKHKIKGKLK